MQSLEVSGAVRPIYVSLGVKRLIEGTVRYVYMLRCITELFYNA